MQGRTTNRNRRRLNLAHALIFGAMGAAGIEPALSQDLQQVSDERIEFDIAAQPLSGALTEFARQSRINALYFSDDLSGLSSPQLRGSYTPQQALDLLLARSGYSGRISGENLVLAQEQSSRPQRESAATNGAEGRSDADEGGSGAEDELVVTGTRIRGAAPAGAHIETLTREEIEQTGRSTVQDVLQTLPQNFPGLIMPNGWSISLRAMPGADAAGSAGLSGNVDTHIGRIVVASLISAVLGVAANESEAENDARTSQSIGDAAAQQAAQTGSRIVDRELNVRPTLRIRAGARVRVLVSHDIQLRPYPP